jgi:hypothetical protein
VPTALDPCSRYSDGKLVTEWVLSLRAGNQERPGAVKASELAQRLKTAGITVYQVEKIARSERELGENGSLTYADLSTVLRYVENSGAQPREFFLRVEDPGSKKAVTLPVRFTRNEFALLHGSTPSGSQVRYYRSSRGKSQILVWKS